MRNYKKSLKRVKKRWLALLFTSIALTLFRGIYSGDFSLIQKTTTYGNFDVLTQSSAIQTLLPGVPDMANRKVYIFGHSVHREPLIALGTLFLIFFLLRAVKSYDIKVGIHRWFFQWVGFVLTRLGVFRVSGVHPVKRCAFGVFPFLNCQACEMATGACPIGQIQGFLAARRFPFLVLFFLITTGLMLGRWVCGWLCPFGFFLDIVDRISVNKVKFPYLFSIVKFYMLGITVLLGLFFGLFMFTTVYPFCSFVCPSGLVYGLLPYYATTASKEFKEVLSNPGGNPIAFFIILFHSILLLGYFLISVLTRGRFFCKYLCPLGAFLGLFNRISFVKIAHIEAMCDNCGLCTKTCPMEIDLSKGDFLTVSNCIRCSTCVHECRRGARKWQFGFGWKGEKQWNQDMGYVLRESS